MTGCCNENDAALVALRERQSRMLWTVLAINAVMFVVEFGAGWLAGSTALLADSLDMLGDTLVYSLSLIVVARGDRWKAISAGFKGAIMVGFGLVVLAEAANKAYAGAPPVVGLMAGVGLLALTTNASCLYLLTRHRDDDVNMRSSWVCSRNDLIANSGVLLAAGLVLLTDSRWPDVVIGVLIAAVFLRSAAGVLRQSRQTYCQASGDGASSGPGQ